MLKQPTHSHVLNFVTVVTLDLTTESLDSNLSMMWLASICLTVPDLDRITNDWV